MVDLEYLKIGRPVSGWITSLNQVTTFSGFSGKGKSERGTDCNAREGLPRGNPTSETLAVWRVCSCACPPTGYRGYGGE